MLPGILNSPPQISGTSEEKNSKPSVAPSVSEFPKQENLAREISHDQQPDPRMSSPQVVEGWPGFIAFLENHNPILWAKVSHCKIKASGESLELQVPDLFEKSANGPVFIQDLDDAALAFFGSRFQWVIIKEPSQKPRGVSPQGAKAGKPSGGKQIVNHPAVQQAMEILGAELIEVKPSKGTGAGAGRGVKKRDK